MVWAHVQKTANVFMYVGNIFYSPLMGISIVSTSSPSCLKKRVGRKSLGYLDHVINLLSLESLSGWELLRLLRKIYKAIIAPIRL